MTPPSIEEFLQQSDLSEAAIQRFVEAHDFPILENSGATFVFIGDVDEVLLQHWIFGLPSAQPFRRVEETDLWYFHLQLPEDARVEYKFEIVKNGDREWILDPLNPRRAYDPFGANSVCYGPEYVRPDWTLPQPGVRRGTMVPFAIRSRWLGGSRRFQVYVPARFRTRRRYSLLIIHDGEDFLRYAQMKTVLDNLIHRFEIAPLIAVFTHPRERLKEYGADPRHAGFLVEELIPFLEKRYPLLPNAAARGVMGASFGAVASFAAASEYPGVFGRLLIQSGSFVFADIGWHRRGPEFDQVAEFMNQFRRQPRPVAERVFVSCGIFEPLIYENRSLIPLLQKTRIDVRYVETRDGHNWENWRDRCRDALSWLFPGPLWMMYE